MFKKFVNTTVRIYAIFRSVKEYSALWGRAFIGRATLNLDWMQYDSCTKNVLLRHRHAKNVFPGDFLIPRENESETLLTITGTLRSHVNKSSALFNFLYTNWKIKWHNTRMIMKWQKKLFYTVGSIFHSRSFNIVKLQPYQSKNVSIVLNYLNCITIPLALNLWKLSHWTALMRNTCNKHWLASFSHLYWHYTTD